MSQKRPEYIEEQDSIKFNLLGIHSRDFSRRQHSLDLVCHKAKKLASDGEYEVLKGYLPTILRLANVCPFEDVRKSFTKLLLELKVSLC